VKVTPAETMPVLPFERPSLLEIAPLLLELQAERPIARVRTPAGDPAWLVTRYADVKELFADRRLGRGHPDPERAPRFTNSVILGTPMGRPETQAAQHARMRRALTPSFMAKRMNGLRAGIQAIVDGALDEIEALPRPVDLHAELAVPVPILVICELLGVPYEDRERFRAWSDQAVSMGDRERSRAGMAALHEYMGGLLARKRERRAQDVLSDLIAAGEADPEFTEQEMISIAAGLLFAGHETTILRMEFGILLLLANPVQRQALQEDPSLARTAVEEVLRMAVPGLDLIPRYALTDVEADGATIRSGDLVLLSRAAANRDPAAFADPERFDVRRQENQHVSFGHGHHFCLGAALARVELQTVLGTLFHRLPTLRLAVPLEELRRRDDALTGGLRALPVTW
jgi:pentalenolactone synthase